MKPLSKDNLIKILLLVVPLLSLVLGFTGKPTKVYAATTRIDLLTADSFAILAGASIVDSNLSTIIGNVGLSPASGSFIGLTCVEVTGSIYAVDAAGPLPCSVADSGLLTTAKNNLTTAYTNAANSTPVTALAGSDNQLGGQTLTDGIYSFGGASTANLIGTLTLDGQGNADSVFIFQAASTLITSSASEVVLINGAQSCNVFWQVSTSATLGTGTDFVGTIMADQSITDNGGSTIDGRFLARIATVTVDNTTITKPTCAPGTAGAPTPGTSTQLAAAAAAIPGPPHRDCPDLSDQIISPIIFDYQRIDADSIFISWGPYSGVNTFNVRYGYSDGNWQYNTDVTGFSTTINLLPLGQPIWVQVAARNDCMLGTYGPSRFVGGPILPATGFATNR